MDVLFTPRAMSQAACAEREDAPPDKRPLRLRLKASDLRSAVRARSAPGPSRACSRNTPRRRPKKLLARTPAPEIVSASETSTSVRSPPRITVNKLYNCCAPLSVTAERFGPRKSGNGGGLGCRARYRSAAAAERHRGASRSPSAFRSCKFHSPESSDRRG